ncbi:MAG TPA: cache domain-containing protein [Candidatus Saccharimonadales bacterium]|nr:cache domain-containing protein [Candidatus Saccharimonadales bacterium]
MSLHTITVGSTLLKTTSFGSYISESSVHNYTVYTDKILLLDFFTVLVGDRIDNIIDMLEFLSKDDLFSSFPHISNVSEIYHGIPPDMDNKKRHLLNDVMKLNPDIASIHVVLPDGNIYLGEPYYQQEQHPKLNFADREWYTGVTKSNHTYVSSVFLSASINTPAIAIAVPVLSDSENGRDPSTQNNRLLAHLVGIVNLQSVKELFNNLESNQFGRFYVLDKNGTELIDSFYIQKNTTINEFDFIDNSSLNEFLSRTTNSAFVSNQDNTVFFYKPISVRTGGELIAALVTEK